MMVFMKTNTNTAAETTARYNTAVETWLTAWGWQSLAADLEAAAAQVTGGRRQQLLDRATDCRARAQRAA